MNPYGKEFTWCYRSYSQKKEKHLVCFQWLMFQGSEFHIECDSRLQAEKLIKQLARMVGEKPRHTCVGGTHVLQSRYQRWEWDFQTVRMTITPEHVEYATGLEVVLTPTTLTVRELLIKEFSV